jgi:hypothetical protein
MDLSTYDLDTYTGYSVADTGPSEEYGDAWDYAYAFCRIVIYPIAEGKRWKPHRWAVEHNGDVVEDGVYPTMDGAYDQAKAALYAYCDAVARDEMAAR